MFESDRTQIHKRPCTESASETLYDVVAGWKPFLSKKKPFKCEGEYNSQQIT